MLKISQRGTDHQIGASFDHLVRAIGVVVDPSVSLEGTFLSLFRSLSSSPEADRF